MPHLIRRNNQEKRATERVTPSTDRDYTPVAGRRTLSIDPELWDAFAEWITAWQQADSEERHRLTAQLAEQHPELMAEAPSLMAAAENTVGFLETPALVLTARVIAYEDPVLAPGTAIGPYRVVDLLARGGMGDVYRANDERLQRHVALKVLAETKTGDPRRVERFMQEARVTASLDHPNVVRVYDVGRIDGRAYLVAELLEGETLRSRIDRGSLSPAEAVRIGREIASGLSAAHAAGLVHRDLKPDNIFLTQSGGTKILDFGIAKLAQDESVADGLSTLTGVVFGTAGYLSPEQIRGERVDARADLFALGAVLFEMLTGTRPFARNHLVESLHAILHDAPSNALIERHDVPAGLIVLVMTLLDKISGRRPRSSDEVIAALDSIDMTKVGRRLRWPTSRARWVAAALTLALAAGAGAALYVRRASTATAPAGSVTLAVMPFRSIPKTADSDLFELGFADVFISRLGQLSDVRVLPLTATERLRAEDPLEVARTLGATHVLTVNIQRDRSGVRATPQLLAASDGRMVWSTHVDTDALSVFSIQDIVVRRVIEELAPRLGSNVRSRIAQAGTRNSQAFDAYLRGRAAVGKPTPVDLKNAAEFFQQAVTLDPGYADAWAGLASAYKRMPVVAAGVPDAFIRARNAATRALQLVPDHPEAISVLGTVAFWYEWDYPRAEQLLRRALTLQPSSADTQVFLAHLYSNLGRHDEAIEEIRRARALDPDWPVPQSLEGQFLHMARRDSEAVARLDALLEAEPQFWTAHYFRVWALIGLGRYEDAVRGCDRVIEIRRGANKTAPDYAGAVAYKGYALAKMGRFTEAENLLHTLNERPTADQMLTKALILHGLRRESEATELLRQAAERRELAVTFLGVEPLWDDLRSSSDFRAVLSLANLLDVSDRTRR